MSNGDTLLGLLRGNRQIAIDAIGNELNRLCKEKDRIKITMSALWDIRAELYRDLEPESNKRA